MNTANLTRFGPENFSQPTGACVTYSASFRAINGPAKLIVQNHGVQQLELKINGRSIDFSLKTEQNSEIQLDIILPPNNTLEVSLEGNLSIRVTQITHADLGLLRQGYFGLNTTDLARQRKFYETLGFIGEIYPAGPETSTTFAQALGFEDDYLIHVSLHSLENPPTPPFVDTVQFRGDSYREEPPYSHLNHIGMTYATYSTRDLDSDYAYLKSNHVPFLSPPTHAPNGEYFVYFQDQDGAFLKLLQSNPPATPSQPPNLTHLLNTNMNVTDLERSREFYRLLGFTESTPNSQAGGGEFARAHGFDHPIEFIGQDISLGKDTDGATLQLRQWKTPHDDTPPYAPPVNHLGIDRINFYVKDLTAAVNEMLALGFEPLGPIGGSAEIGIVFFFDPDGIKVQLAGPQSA